MARRLTTTERGYGTKHQELRRRWQRIIDRTGAACWRCGAEIRRGDEWHLGHDDHDRTVYRGPECVLCNLRAAAVKGNIRRRAKKAVRQISRLAW